MPKWRAAIATKLPPQKHASLPLEEQLEEANKFLVALRR